MLKSRARMEKQGESGHHDVGEAANAKGCPAKMDNRTCGRPIYDAPSGVDEIPVCLMHSRDSKKSDSDFQGEFERILAEAGWREEGYPVETGIGPVNLED